MQVCYFFMHRTVLFLDFRCIISRYRDVWKHSYSLFSLSSQDILRVADHAVQTIRNGGKVLVSCLSGRGRSGTFSALVIGASFLSIFYCTNRITFSLKWTALNAFFLPTFHVYSYVLLCRFSGKLQAVTTHSQLVDIVVSMREQRDGMLETPAQFRFVARLLNLPSTADCGMYCNVSHHVAEHESYRLIIALVSGALLVLLPVLIVMRKTRI